MRLLDYFTGEASHDQEFHQLAFYVQDDWRVSRKLTLNLGLRWDANIGLLTDQTNNRTMDILRQLDDPRAQAIAGDTEKLGRSTPSWKEFQPRIGFAYDIARRRAHGRPRRLRDLLRPDLPEPHGLLPLPERARVLRPDPRLHEHERGGGAAPELPLRRGPAARHRPRRPSGPCLAGTFGRITDPDARDPYVQKFSIGFQRALGGNWVLSSDFVHTLGLHEPRVLVVNPQIRPVCDPTFAGSTPTSPRCVAGPTTRYFDQAFVAAGLGVNRLGQINMISTTNRSLFDSWTTTLRGRTGRVSGSVSYVLASSRSVGRPAHRVLQRQRRRGDPEQQFAEGEFGPTRNDERHRVVASAVIDLPLGFQVAPLVQFSTSRPYTPTTGFDINGDGLTNSLDRLCSGASLDAVFAARGNAAGDPRPSIPNGCTPAGPRQPAQRPRREPGRQRRGAQRPVLQRRPAGHARPSASDRGPGSRSTPTSTISSTPRTSPSTCERPRTDESQAVAATFLQPLALWGPGFGPPVAKPFTAVVRRPDRVLAPSASSRASGLRARRPFFVYHSRRPCPRRPVSPARSSGRATRSSAPGRSRSCWDGALPDHPLPLRPGHALPGGRVRTIVPAAEPGAKGPLSPFQAFMTALAGTIGTGNIAGVATAVVSGGPGAVFWIWCYGFVATAIKFTEAVLGIQLPRPHRRAPLRGADALPARRHEDAAASAWVYALVAGIGRPHHHPLDAAQLHGPRPQDPVRRSRRSPPASRSPCSPGSSSSAGSSRSGGPRRSSRRRRWASTSLGGLFVIVTHLAVLPEVLALIFREAFSLKGAIGGTAGVGMMMAMRYGLARGIYANEAGYGTAAVVYGTARSDRPVQQGLNAVMEVFIVSFVTSSISALTILLTGAWRSGETSTAAVALAFNALDPGRGRVDRRLLRVPVRVHDAHRLGLLRRAIPGVRFRPARDRALSLDLLRPDRGRVPPRKVDLVWAWGDLMNGLQIFPNLVGVLGLSGVVAALLREPTAQRAERA